MRFLKISFDSLLRKISESISYSAFYQIRLHAVTYSGGFSLLWAPLFSLPVSPASPGRCLLWGKSLWRGQVCYCGSDRQASGWGSPGSDAQDHEVCGWHQWQRWASQGDREWPWTPVTAYSNVMCRKFLAIRPLWYQPVRLSYTWSLSLSSLFFVSTEPGARPGCLFVCF